MGSLIEAFAPVLNILKVALGLGFVIFIHELGHFLLAKWNGVKVEKFSIGFGPTLLGFQRGETEYVLAAIPLGGFVKMLGENPEGEAAQSTDPRAFHNKSVGGRMAIISAGVIMNIIFGILCNIFVFTQPREELAASLGTVNPGSPAYMAGLKSGDEVISIDGQKDLGFSDLTRKVVLSSEGQELDFVVKRKDVEAPLSFKVKARRESELARPAIGVLNPLSLELVGFSLPAGMADAPKYPEADEATAKETNDFVTAVAVEGEAPKPLTTVAELQDFMARNATKPLVLSIERRPEDPNSSLKTSEFTFKLPVNTYVDFGMRMEIGYLLAVRPNSPAEKAGFLAGDTIVQVDGKEDFDPFRLPALCQANHGKPMAFVVERTDDAGKTRKITLTVTPGDVPPWIDPRDISVASAIDVSSLGICYQVPAKVRSVVAGSPADKAGIKPGDVVDLLTVTPKKTEKPTNPSEKTAKAETEKAEEVASPVKIRINSPFGWLRAFFTIQAIPASTISLSLNDGKKTVEIQPVRDAEWFNPARGLVFQPLAKRLPGLDLSAAARAGVEETYSKVLEIYITLRSFVLGRIGTSNLGGPILIATTAYRVAETNWTNFISFLGLMSINLAVLNFLPIPPLDGGQMTFLLIEKVRGKPLPESVIIGALYIGLPLILLLMVFALSQDIFRLVKDFFGP